MTYSEFLSAALPAIESVRISGPTVLEWALDSSYVRREGIWCEFGVFRGRTLRLLAEHRGNAKLWGFDSFRGLPSDWFEGHPKGEFALDAIPLPPEGVNLVVGPYAETLRHWLPCGPVTLAHIDCDLYESTMLALRHIALVPGSVIVFDELVGYPAFEEHEMRALYESGIKFGWLASRSEAVAILVKEAP